MEDKSKFVQIAATGNDLYALDQNGDVWVIGSKPAPEKRTVDQTEN